MRRSWERHLQNGKAEGNGTGNSPRTASGESRNKEPRAEHNSVTLYAMNGDECGHYTPDPEFHEQERIVEVFDRNGKAAEIAVPNEGNYIDVALVERTGRPGAPAMHIPVYSDLKWQTDIIPAHRHDLRDKNLLYTVAAAIAENPDADADTVQGHVRGAIASWKTANPQKAGPTQPDGPVGSEYWIG